MQSPEINPLISATIQCNGQGEATPELGNQEQGRVLWQQRVPVGLTQTRDASIEVDLEPDRAAMAAGRSFSLSHSRRSLAASMVDLRPL